MPWWTQWLPHSNDCKHHQIQPSSEIPTHPIPHPGLPIFLLFLSTNCHLMEYPSCRFCRLGILRGRSNSTSYIQHCMDLQLAVDPYKKRVLFESMDWLPKTHIVSWHISANQISTKHSPTVVVWCEEWGLQFLLKSDIWQKNWSPFCLFLDLRNRHFDS